MKFHVFGTSKHGEGKSLLVFLLFLSVNCGDFIEQIKKVCHIHFNREKQSLLIVELNNMSTKQRKNSLRGFDAARSLARCFSILASQAEKLQKLCERYYSNKRKLL